MCDSVVKGVANLSELLILNNPLFPATDKRLVMRNKELLIFILLFMSAGSFKLNIIIFSLFFQNSFLQTYDDKIVYHRGPKKQSKTTENHANAQQVFLYNLIKAKYYIELMLGFLVRNNKFLFTCILIIQYKYSTYNPEISFL